GRTDEGVAARAGSHWNQGAALYEAAGPLPAAACAMAGEADETRRGGEERRAGIHPRARTRQSRAGGSGPTESDPVDTLSADQSTSFSSPFIRPMWPGKEQKNS